MHIAEHVALPTQAETVSYPSLTSSFLSHGSQFRFELLRKTHTNGCRYRWFHLEKVWLTTQLASHERQVKLRCKMRSRLTNVLVCPAKSTSWRVSVFYA